MAKLRAGIVGGAGYTGGELIRLLINHPDVTISFIHSKSNAGNAVSHVHADLAGETDLTFTTDLCFLPRLIALSSSTRCAHLAAEIVHGQRRQSSARARAAEGQAASLRAPARVPSRR